MRALGNLVRTHRVAHDLQSPRLGTRQLQYYGSLRSWVREWSQGSCHAEYQAVDLLVRFAECDLNRVLGDKSSSWYTRIGSWYHGIRPLTLVSTVFDVPSRLTRGCFRLRAAMAVHCCLCLRIA